MFQQYIQSRNRLLYIYEHIIFDNIKIPLFLLLLIQNRNFLENKENL